MNQPCIYVGKVGETVKYGWARHPRRGTVGPTPRMQNLVLPIQYAHQAAPSRRGSLWQVSGIPPRSKPCSWSSIFCTIPSSGGGARVQSDDHHVQANLPAAKTTTHTMRNRNIETAKLACFLNSLRPSFIRVVRRKNIERTKRKIGIAAARKAMILKIIIHSQCRVTRSLDHLVGAGEQRFIGLIQA